MTKILMNVILSVFTIAICTSTLSQVAPYPQRTILAPTPTAESTVGIPEIAAERSGNFILRTIQSIGGIFSPTSQNIAEPQEVVETKTYSIEGAEWLILEFEGLLLDSQSIVTVTSTSDGNSQIITPEMVEEGIENTIAFNGDTVVVELQVPVGDEYFPLSISSIVAGESPDSDPDLNDDLHPQSLGEAQATCGPEDDRTPSLDNRVGRLMTIGCTAWAIPGNLFLTAGHCVGRKMAVLQYNVPASKENGTPVMPPSEDQFIVNRSSIIYSNNDIGDDWAVFRVLANVNGKLPHELYETISIDNSLMRPQEVTVVGFGLDDEPTGPLPKLLNSSSQTQQSHKGPFIDYSQNNNVVEHRVDTRGGNSGGPIIVQVGEPTTDVSIGIHTHGGCDEDPTVNHGTSFLNLDLISTIQTMSQQ